MQRERPNWFAVFTKPRQERVAKENLEHQGFRCFLPMAINPYQRRSVSEPRIEPLFPRYLFLNARPGRQSLGLVRSTRGVSSLVRFGMQLVEVPDAVIAGIKARQDPASGLVRLKPVPVEVGDRVRVFDGPFAGIEGIFKRRSGRDRALLLLQVLGRESTVEVGALLLQRAI